MSRSYKKTPISSICGARSDKPWKKQCSRQYRAQCKALMYHGIDEIPKHKKAHSYWDSIKDCKIYWDTKDVIERRRWVKK